MVCTIANIIIVISSMPCINHVLCAITFFCMENFFELWITMMNCSFYELSDILHLFWEISWKNIFHCNFNGLSIIIMINHVWRSSFIPFFIWILWHIFFFILFIFQSMYLQMFLRIYPIVHMFLKAVSCVSIFGFVLGKLPFHSPLLTLAGVRLKNLTPEDMEEQSSSPHLDLRGKGLVISIIMFWI